jgi:hypothetical protein
MINVLELMKQLNGEILSNKARVTYNGKVEIIGRLMGTEWEITERGAKISHEWNAKQAEAAKAEPAKKKPATRTRKSSK